MLDFLPLQPIASTSNAMPVGPLSPLSPVSPLELPEASCSLEALRSSLALALPPQPAYQRNLEFVTLPTPDEAPTESVAEELVVRPLRRADVDQVRQLQDACLPVVYPPSFYTVLLTNPSSLCLVAYSPSSPSTLLGCISAHVSYPSSSFTSSSRTPASSPTIYILSLAVARPFRQRGLASHLVRSISKALLPRPLFCGFKQRARVSLHVEVENAAARELYKRLGLQEKGRKAGFYSRLRNGGRGEAVEMEGVLEV
ncbi:GNAT family N-acetyltransferase [Rhodotorula paludigena]|uniref:GNAT family N-acetyltransferase n=1 Tax=Rhodotorula paludigena TaxID=86838 RepID=UPI003178517B